VRLLKLYLTAFGAFEGRTLDFSAKPGVLSVVYGKNEAGKSTSLRAYEGLLFGIDSTADAFRHQTKKLRVGGTFLSDGGEVITFFRRRGRKDTLIDEADKPIDESRLKRLLRGVDRDLFGALYGLDHVRLREGKKALFAEGSSVAEGLFEASLSGAGVGQLAKALRSEAEALFTARATQRPLNEALRAYASAIANTRMYATSSATYQRQLEAIEAAKQVRQAAEEDLVNLERARRRIERGLRVAPLLSRRRNLLSRRAELGEVAHLPESATSERERHQAERLAAEDSLRDLVLAQQKVEHQLAALPSVELPFDAAETRAELSELLGSARDNPQRQAELAAERAALEAIAVDQPVRPRVFDVASERAVLDLLTAREESRRAALRAEEQRDEERAAEQQAASLLAEIEPYAALEVERLRMAVAVSEAALLRTAQRDEQVAKRIEREAHARALASELGAGSLEELAKREAPPLEELEAMRRRFETLSRAALEHSGKLSELAGQQTRARRDRDELLARGPALSEADLDRARLSRDSALEAAFSDGTDKVRSAARERVRDADALSDRLRIEADRLARLAAVERSLAVAETAIAEIGAVHERAASEAALVAQTVRERLERAGGPALEPELASSWFARRASALEAFASSRAAGAATGAIEADVAGITASLREVLGVEAESGAGASDVFAALRELVANGRSALSEQGAARGRFEKLTLERDSARTSALRAELRAQAAAASMREASLRVDVLLGEMGLERNASREDVVRFAQETRRAADAVAKLRKILAEIGRAAELDERLTRKTRTIADALGRASLPVDRVAAAELTLADLSRAHRDAEARREVERSLTEIGERVEAASERKRRADAALMASMRRAGVEAESDLPAAEQRSSLVERLSRDVESVEIAIYAAGGEVAVAELEQEYAGFDVEQAELEDARAEDERVTLERRKEQASQQRVSLEQAASQWHESRASEFAEQAASHLARAKSLALRYARLRLGSALLDREVEQYQSLHQAPVVARASQHFRALSSGSYQGVRVTLNDDDQPELSSLRGSEEVGIDGLSDGAKDQLFLALRLATIERHAEGVESLPLVFDDVLVHFDDERSQAALELFASIAPRMQVLLFTHQERVVELAAKLGPARVQIVNL